MKTENHTFATADALVYEYLTTAGSKPYTTTKLTFVLDKGYVPVAVSISTNKQVATERELEDTKRGPDNGIISTIMLPYFGSDIAAKCIVTITSPTQHRDHTEVGYKVIGANNTTHEETTFIIRCGKVDSTKMKEETPTIASDRNKVRVNSIGQLILSHYDRSCDHLTVTDLHVASTACAIYRLLHCYKSVEFTYDNRFHAITKIDTPDNNPDHVSNSCPLPFSLMERLQDPSLYHSIIKYISLIRRESNPDATSTYIMNRAGGSKKE